MLILVSVRVAQFTIISIQLRTCLDVIFTTAHKMQRAVCKFLFIRSLIINTFNMIANELTHSIFSGAFCYQLFFLSVFVSQR